MPFGTDCFRGPANYLFANRSFIGKTMCNVRAVGAKLTYIPLATELYDITIDAGAFNPTLISDHSRWENNGLCREGGLSFAKCKACHRYSKP